MSKDGKIWLSHSGLEVKERCPRCFWLQYVKGVYPPEGIVSRLPGRFDRIIKNYFDTFRPELPPMVEEKLEGKLQNPFISKYEIVIDEKYGFKGFLDECLINNRDEAIPVDFKTSSTDPREKERFSAYQSQIDAYVFILKQSGKKVAGHGYLIYFYPDHSDDLHNGFKMIIHVDKVIGDPGSTAKKIAEAIKVLEGKIPKASADCSFCRYRELKVED